jgi:hypothetical protein
MENLESKLNQLLESASIGSGNVASSHPGNRAQSPKSDRRIAADTAFDEAFASSTSRGDQRCRGVIDDGLLNVETAESLVQIFKVSMSPHFPFVMLHSEMTAQRLRQEQPFTLLAVLAAASYDHMPLQRRLGKEVKKAVASRMIVGEEVSFDMLRGLLVHLAWCAPYRATSGRTSLTSCRSQYYSRPRRYSQFLQLAISLVVDLRLDRPPLTQSWKTGVQFRSEPTDKGAYRRPSWGRDEQRALAGRFYLSST